jgi:hypothetical protein
MSPYMPPKYELRLTLLGHGCQLGHVCVWHTHGHHNGQEEPQTCRHYWHVCALCRLLSHQACVRWRPRLHERCSDILLFLLEWCRQLCCIPGRSKDSDAQLANPSRIGHRLPIGSFWLERLFLHSHRRHSIPRRYLRTAHDAFSCDLTSCSSIDTLPNRRRPQSWHWLCCPTHQRTCATQFQRPP